MAAPPITQNLIEPVPDCHPEIGRWLWALQDSRQRTLSSLMDLEPGALDRRDPRGGNSIGTLLYHLAAIEADWLYVDVLGEGFTPELEALLPFDVRDEKGDLVPVLGLPLGEHLRRLEAVRVLLLRAYQGMSLAAFRRPRDMGTYQVTPEWVLHHLMQHEAEHRGQIGELRRA